MKKKLILTAAPQLIGKFIPHTEAARVWRSLLYHDLR